MSYLIWGKGSSGLSAYELLKAKNYKVYIGDDKEDENLWRELINEVDIIVLSPGIPPSHPLWQEAIKKDKELIGETELAYRFYKGKNIIAITGTDGKSTTVHLVHTILGFEEGGNFGTPFSQIILENEKADVVLEISSFQGKTLKTFRPNLGVFLNFSEDHLDWHPDLNDYLSSKQNIFKNQTPNDLLILNISKPVSETPSQAKKVFFGDDAPLRVLNNSIYYEDKKLLDIKNQKLKGKHNMYNIAIASFIAFYYNIDIDIITSRLNSFEPLPYRYTHIGNFNGINIYNDSKSTTVNALLSALESTSPPIILILGGIDKGGDFTKLKVYKDKIKHTIIFGKDKHAIKEQIEEFLKVSIEESLEDAISKAKNLASNNDNILFSPACASFDMFENYKDRGNTFNKLIKKHFSSL